MLIKWAFTFMIQFERIWRIISFASLSQDQEYPKLAVLHKIYLKDFCVI